MEINLVVVLLLLFCHWVADFVCQTDWMAQNKSKSMKALLSHTSVYSGVFALFLIFNLHLTLLQILAFVGITFVAHTITDYFTSRLNSILWAKKDVHNFFVSVGADQFLHFFQLLLTYWWLTN